MPTPEPRQRQNMADASTIDLRLDADGSLIPSPADDNRPLLLESGALIDDTYEIVSELGRGAMGVVLLATDKKLERDVAIKVIRPERLRPGFAERFAQEARVMARLNHPNVVTIHSYGEYSSLPYFVMELVSGQTLADWQALEPVETRLPQALAILNDVCLGLEEIHREGTLHRDVKPSNILLDHSLRARIADFGISTQFDSDGEARVTFAGTPTYMAPEVAFSQGKSGVITPVADVYSLACVAYETLTGRLPVDGPSDLELLAQHAIAQVPAPSSVESSLPRSFDRPLLDALAKDPKQRTDSVEAFRQALRDARKRVFEPTRILVAEDDADFREALELKLRMAFPDTEIVCVGDGAQALRAARERPVSVALLDLQMPEMGAGQVTSALRAESDTANIPIVVLTAAGGPREWAKLQSIGVDRFLVKPVELTDVVALIRRMMRWRFASGSDPNL